MFMRQLDEANLASKKYLTPHWLQRTNTAVINPSPNVGNIAMNPTAVAGIDNENFWVANAHNIATGKTNQDNL